MKVPQVRNCLEGNTMSNPVHTSETRMCGGEKPRNTSTAWRAVHRERSCVKSIMYSLPGWQRVEFVPVRGHPILRRVCTSVTHSIAFQAISNS